MVESPKAFVGNLNKNTNESDIATIFSKYGNIRQVCVSVPPSFAFVIFEDFGNAKEAVTHLDGMLVY